MIEAGITSQILREAGGAVSYSKWLQVKRSQGGE